LAITAVWANYLTPINFEANRKRFIRPRKTVTAIVTAEDYVINMSAVLSFNDGKSLAKT